MILHYIYNIQKVLYTAYTPFAGLVVTAGHAKERG
jgi:hypothetical protein